MGVATPLAASDRPGDWSSARSGRGRDRERERERAGAQGLPGDGVRGRGAGLPGPARKGLRGRVGAAGWGGAYYSHAPFWSQPRFWLDREKGK